MNPVLLGLQLFPDLNFDTSGLLWAGIAFVVYLVLSRFVGPTNAKALIALTQRAINFLPHVEKLGLSTLLGPLVKELISGNWSSVPQHVHQLFDQLDNKETRRGILLSVAKALLRDQITDPEKKGPILTFLRDELGLTITEK